MKLNVDFDVNNANKINVFRLNNFRGHIDRVCLPLVASKKRVYICVKKGEDDITSTIQ